MNETITIERADNADGRPSILRLNGPLTITTLFSFQEAVRKDPPQALILDLAQVPYMDSAGLGSVVNAFISYQKNGRRLALIGVSERLMNLIKLTKVDMFLPVYSNASEAESKLAKPVGA
ncbi:MAG TPA: STAS domain-containing protein [Terriglobales bacterium]|nr:STAS domain-containing protein [Terriglobales bacterium]